MGIIKYHQDMKIINKFDDALQKFCAMEKEGKKIYYDKHHSSYDYVSVRDVQIAVQKICQKKYGQEYQACRTEIAQLIPIMQNIAENLEISTYRIGQAPAMLGGARYEIEVFNTLLEQSGLTELEPTVVIDTVNKMKGRLKENIKIERARILNPLTWISFALKIPFLLLKQTGFNVDKIENELWGKLIKTLCLILLLWMALRLGFSKEQLMGFFKFK